MNLSNQIHASPQQIEKLIAEYPKDTPVVMINIIRFREKVEGGEASGESSYARYGKNVLPFLKSAGGRLLWRGEVRNVVIGDDEKPPHLVLLVQYPSVDQFIEMVTNPEYQKIANDRTIALDYGGLLASETEVNFM